MIKIFSNINKLTIMMLKLVLLIVSLEAMAGEEAYCDKNDLRYLFAQVLNMDKHVKQLNTKLEELNSKLDETIVDLNSTRNDIREQLKTITASIEKSNQKVVGGWNIWGSWSECSASCNTGMASRNRTCSNPKPSNGGDYCFGETAEYRLCNKFACPDVHVGFTVYNGDSSSGTYPDPLKFQSTLYNSDASFNNLTGVFTCIHPGVYFFSATVMRTSACCAYYCYFMVNNNNSGIFVLANDYNNSASYPGSTTSIVLRLEKNDTVNLGACYYGSYMLPSGVSFTGFRISP